MRGKPWASATMLNEAEWNDRYDQEELEKVRESEEQLETLLEEDQQKHLAMALPGKGASRVASRIHPSLPSSGIYQEGQHHKTLFF